MNFRDYVTEAKKILGELKSFFVNKGRIELTIKDYDEENSFDTISNNLYPKSIRLFPGFYCWLGLDR